MFKVGEQVVLHNNIPNYTNFYGWREQALIIKSVVPGSGCNTKYELQDKRGHSIWVSEGSFGYPEPPCGEDKK